jgi:GT2 family glycosyltransferase
MGDKIFPYLEGWLLATTAESWKELGYFDERYAPHIFEDIDLSTTALSLGMQLVPLNNPNLSHAGGGTITYTEQRHELTRVNMKKFGEKWTNKK